MFRALRCSSSGGLRRNCVYAGSGNVTLCRWLSWRSCVGGTILRTLFETATLADLNKLHNTLDELQDKNSDIVHSLFDQVTYVKKLDTVIGINSQTIANLTSIIKDNLIHSQENFQNITNDLSWLHFTIGQSALFTAIRQIWITPVSSVSNGLYFLTVPLVSHARYLYIKRNV
jgi:hypothetical protein